MAGVPINFAVPGENVVSSYDYVDIANGLGYINFYCLHNSDGTFSLTTNSQIVGGVIQHYVSNTGTIMEETFEVTINSPKTINGDCITQIPVSAENASSFGVTCTIYNGVTQLGTATGTYSIERASATTLVSQKISISNTHLKKGDVLKFYIKVTWTDPGNNFGYAAHDPSGGTFTSRIDGTSLQFRTTRMGVAIPFKIDN